MKRGRKPQTRSTRMFKANLESFEHEPLSDLLESGCDVRDQVDNLLLIDQIDVVLSTLSERERLVVIARTLNEETLEVIGKRHGVTRERIRQIHAKALRKLRHPTRAEHLASYFVGLEETLKKNQLIEEEKEKKAKLRREKQQVQYYENRKNFDIARKKRAKEFHASLEKEYSIDRYQSRLRSKWRSKAVYDFVGTYNRQVNAVEERLDPALPEVPYTGTCECTGKVWRASYRYPDPSFEIGCNTCLTTFIMKREERA